MKNFIQKLSNPQFPPLALFPSKTFSQNVHHKKFDGPLRFEAKKNREY